MQRLFAPGHVAACVLSSDTPTLPTAALVRAAELLLTGDDGRVVLGACDDGGYYLLGMRTLHAGLFTDIPWRSQTSGRSGLGNLSPPLVVDVFHRAWQGVALLHCTLLRARL
jgi:glycosyltransferase A (GT-A) superfamily protein (DUF2064 family)